MLRNASSIMYGYDYNKYFQGKPTWVKPAVIAIAVILILLVVYFLVKKIAAIFGFGEDKDAREYVETPEVNYQSGEGDLLNFDPGPYVNDLKAVLEKKYFLPAFTAGDRCDVYKTIENRLNDNELRLVDAVYKQATQKSIREAIRATSDSGCWVFGSWGTDYEKLLLTRLTRLGL